MTDATSWNNQSDSDGDNNEDTTTRQISTDTTQHTTQPTGAERNDENDTNVVLLNSYNLSNSTKCHWKDLNSQPESKAFVAKRKQGKVCKSLMYFNRLEYKDIFSEIAEKFNIKQKQLIVEYAIRKADNTEEKIEIRFEEEKQLNNTLKMFYCMAEDMSTILVSQLSNPRQRKRPIEELFDEFKKHRTVDRHFFDEEITRDFLKKCMYIQVLLGSSTCTNLLNPGYYFCHIPSCPHPEVALRAFNNISSVYDHWTRHSYQNEGSSKYLYDECCVQLLRRHDHMAKNPLLDNTEKLIDDLEQAENAAGKPFEIHSLMANKKLFFKDSNSSCRDRCADEDVLTKILNGDDDALASISDMSPVSFFSTEKEEEYS